MNPKVSIIIPCKDIDAQTSECIDTCRQLDYGNFEIIVLPDDHWRMDISQDSAPCWG